MLSRVAPVRSTLRVQFPAEEVFFLCVGVCERFFKGYGLRIQFGNRVILRSNLVNVSQPTVSNGLWVVTQAVCLRLFPKYVGYQTQRRGNAYDAELFYITRAHVGHAVVFVAKSLPHFRFRVQRHGVALVALYKVFVFSYQFLEKFFFFFFCVIHFPGHGYTGATLAQNVGSHVSTLNAMLTKINVRLLPD